MTEFVAGHLITLVARHMIMFVEGHMITQFGFFAEWKLQFLHYKTRYSHLPNVSGLCHSELFRDKPHWLTIVITDYALALHNDHHDHQQCYFLSNTGHTSSPGTSISSLTLNMKPTTSELLWFAAGHKYHIMTFHLSCLIEQCHVGAARISNRETTSSKVYSKNILCIVFVYLCVCTHMCVYMYIWWHCV